MDKIGRMVNWSVDQILPWYLWTTRPTFLPILIGDQVFIKPCLINRKFYRFIKTSYKFPWTSKYTIISIFVSRSYDRVVTSFYIIIIKRSSTRPSRNTSTPVKVNCVTAFMLLKQASPNIPIRTTNQNMCNLT